MDIRDMIPQPDFSFKNNTVVKTDSESDKITTVLFLMDNGYKSEYMNIENSLGGKNIICFHGLFHCTDSDSYCSDSDYIDCGTDVEKFKQLSVERK